MKINLICSFGHPEGWPFPLWTQSAGIGWHFVKDNVYGFPITIDVQNWKLTHENSNLF